MSLLNDSGKWYSVREASLKRIAAEYSYEKFKKSVVELFESS